jgi:hypothetical protein
VTEKLFQFIWQFQYFNRGELRTTDDEIIEILTPGQYNGNQGPDFLDARIRIGNTLWIGSIELHLRASDWKRHRHDKDVNYRNVILHVVYEDEGSATTMPVLELRNRIPRILLQRYEELMGSAAFIPCEKNISGVNTIVWKSWCDRLVAERLIRRTNIVHGFLQQNNFHWEETFWWLLARNFGAKINADAFESIARSLPLNILSRHKTQIHQLEGLLMGQAGFLNETFTEDYPVLLQKEYRFYKKKYKLKESPIRPMFLRMRPGNFPTIRLAQLAMLIHGSAHLFSRIRDADNLQDIKEWFDVTANDYWHYHYRFDEISGFKKKKMGDSITDTIIINTICPLLFAFGNYHDEQKYKDKALEWLEQTKPEINSITSGLNTLGFRNGTAFDSQALIELKNEYCNKKRCLECAVGNTIFSSLKIP